MARPAYTCGNLLLVPPLAPPARFRLQQAGKTIEHALDAGALIDRSSCAARADDRNGASHWQQCGPARTLGLQNRPVRGRFYPGERHNACYS